MEGEINAKIKELTSQYLQQGPFVYELYGIMLHNGGAQAGHYSAYIKDFSGVKGVEKGENCWYHFNDTFVKKISVTDLIDAFGKPQNTNGRRFTAANDSNAYLLMYRLIAPPSERIYSITEDLIPPEVQEEVLKQADQQKSETIAQIERRAKM
jgi:hypothetical protein